MKTLQFGNAEDSNCEDNTYLEEGINVVNPI
jgi:hypothetical protein